MKQYIILIAIIFCSIASRAQRFYVEKTDGGYEQPIVDKLIANNYKLTFKKDSADFIIMCNVGKSGMGRAKGSVSIIDNKSGDLLSKSQEATGQTSAFNGYANTQLLCMKKIADKYLIELVKPLTKPK